MSWTKEGPNRTAKLMSLSEIGEFDAGKKRSAKPHPTPAEESKTVGVGTGIEIECSYNWVFEGWIGGKEA